MRLLFHLPYPGYLRLYGTTVEMLAERGHEVLIAYDSEKSRSAAAERVEALDGVRIVDPLPRRDGPLTDLVSQLRIGADYMRYLDPRFSRSPWLRERMERYLPQEIGFLTEAEGLNGPQARTLMDYLRALEASIPTAPGTDEALRALAPDCIVVSPVLARGRSGVHQRDTVKSAKRAGIPVAVAVASWDHLTSKGVLGEIPDKLYVWNNAQKAEAIHLHDVPTERIAVTGAQTFDHWFGMEPAVPREQFLGSLGLDPERICLLYVGSSPNITPVERERASVRRWIQDLRRCNSELLRDANVLIRPHPGNVAGWADIDLGDLGAVAVSPRERPDIVMSAEEEMHYFQSLHYSAAVVGVNTSAMIEAAIVGRAVHTIPTADFAETREGTLHFQLLTTAAGGCLRMADTLEEHFAQLEEAIEDPGPIEVDLQAFVHSFVRPTGLDKPATRVLVKAIERLPK